MKVLLVGGGAREQALAQGLVASKEVELVALLKNKNPGIQSLAAECVWADDTDAVAAVAAARRHAVDLVVIGPEGPLAAGVSDALSAAGFAVAAPSKAAARIETDKAFMRGLMDRHKILGNAGFHVFDDVASATSFLNEKGPEFALKPSGLTGGKGVQVFGDHFNDLPGALEYVNHVFEDDVGGGRLVVEELLRGEEFTLQALTDGRHVSPMPCVQDHKRLNEGDQGPNTGGMGSYSQADGLLPFLTRSDRDDALSILSDIVRALAKEDAPYRGPIYGQFMLTASGPRVVEINARLGDPEAMNVLFLLENGLASVLASTTDGTLGAHKLRFRPLATVVKYVVPKGYGTTPEPGAEIRVDADAIEAAGARLYYAAVDAVGNGIVTTTTSRSLAVLGAGETLHEANRRCENGLGHVDGAEFHVRHDIGTSAMISQRVEHMRLVRDA